MDIDLLRTVSILRHLTDAELLAFSKLLELRVAVIGERILEEGVVVKSFYIVYDGIVHVRRLAQKREMLLGRIGVGGFFGEINLFDPGVATASIYAMKGTKLALVDYDVLRAFLAENPSTGYKIVSAMMTELSRRLRQTSSRLVNSVFLNKDEGAQNQRAS